MSAPDENMRAIYNKAREDGCDTQPEGAEKLSMGIDIHIENERAKGRPLQPEEALNEIMAMFSSVDPDFWKQLTPETLEDRVKSIKQAEKGEISELQKRLNRRHN